MLEILRDLVETDQKGIPDSEPRVEEVWVTAVFAEVPCARGGKIISFHNKLSNGYCQSCHNELSRSFIIIFCHNDVYLLVMLAAIVVVGVTLYDEYAFHVAKLRQFYTYQDEDGSNAKSKTGPRLEDSMSRKLQKSMIARKQNLDSSRHSNEDFKGISPTAFTTVRYWIH